MPEIAIGLRLACPHEKLFSELEDRMYRGNKYRRARLLAALSLHEVSIRTKPKVSVTQLSLFERDLISLPSDKIEAIRKVLNIQVQG